MLEWLFGGKSKSQVRQTRFDKRDRTAIPGKRDWKAGTDPDSTLTHWGQANGAEINQILAQKLDKIITRATYESRANPVIDGTINNHGNDCIGSNGPTLQVSSKSSAWNNTAEEIWAGVSNEITGCGEMSMADLLKQDIRQLWSTGGILSQYVNDNDATTFCKQRLHPIPIQRLYSGYFSTDDTMLGITRNKMGRPTKYHVLESGIEVTSVYRLAINPVEIPAKDIQHVYFKHEPQQWRGYPWLSSCLQAIAELGEYDTAVLDAAKVAAMMAVLFYNTRDDVDSEENPGDIQIKRQSGIKVPTGWQPYALNSNQPTANHVEFRSDRLRDLGRPVGMPLMSIQRDASRHNYSSARFDGQGYFRANQSVQSFLERRRINPFVKLILTEAMLRGILPYRDLNSVSLTWIWPQPPHVDPVKEAMAQRIQMENKTLSPQRACLANNVDFDTICEEWKKANEILVSNGLPEMLGPIPTDPNVLAAMLNGANNENDNNSDSAKPN